MPIWTNLFTNPSFETASGTVTVRTNLVANPGFENGSTAVSNDWGTQGSDVAFARTTDEFHSGGHSLAVTTAAANTGVIYTSPPVGLAAGVLFTVSAWVKAPAGTAMRLYASSFTESGSFTAEDYSAFVATGDWQRVSRSRSNPTSTRIRLGIRAQDAGAHVFYVDDALIETSATMGDYFDGSTPAAGDFSYAWTGAANASTSVQTAPGVAGFPLAISSTEWSSSGDRSLRLPADAQQTEQTLAVTIGKTYTVMATSRSTTATDYRMQTRYYGSAYAEDYGAFIAETGVHAHRMVFTVPAGTTRATLRFNQADGMPGDVWWDDVAIVEGVYTGDFFEGTLQRLYPQITTTAEPPSAHVVFRGDDLADGTESITTYRTADGVTTTVRTSLDLFAAGGVVFDDAEIPVGVPVTYRAQQYDADGAELGYTEPVEVTVPSTGATVGWVSDPLDATRAVRVVLADSAGASLSRKIPGTLHRVGLRTVALVGQRGLLEDLNMDFYTETTAERDELYDLIGATGGLVLIRTPPPLTVPRLLYCWAANATPAGINLPAGEEAVAWSNTVQEISPIEGPVVKAGLTWQVYIDAFPTWADFNGAYLTWLDAMTNPPEA